MTSNSTAWHKADLETCLNLSTFLKIGPSDYCLLIYRYQIGLASLQCRWNQCTLILKSLNYQSWIRLSLVCRQMIMCCFDCSWSRRGSQWNPYQFSWFFLLSWKLVKFICFYSSGICSSLKSSFLTSDSDVLRNQKFRFYIFSMAFRLRLIPLC